MAYKALFTESALKQLRRLDRQVQRRIIVFVHTRLEQLDDPRSVGEALRGGDLGEFWKYRVGDYRLVCDIQDGVLIIEVLKIGNRKEVYR